MFLASKFCSPSIHSKNSIISIWLYLFFYRKVELHFFFHWIVRTKHFILWVCKLPLDTKYIKWIVYVRLYKYTFKTITVRELIIKNPSILALTMLLRALLWNAVRVLQFVKDFSICCRCNCLTKLWRHCYNNFIVKLYGVNFFLTFTAVIWFVVSKGEI